MLGNLEPELAARVQAELERPGATPLTVCLVGKRGTGRLLGGQLVGGGGAKRVDTVATGLHADLATDEPGQVDLAYAPPFSSVWDPVLVAAQALARGV